MWPRFPANRPGSAAWRNSACGRVAVYRWSSRAVRVCSRSAAAGCRCVANVPCKSSFGRSRAETAAMLPLDQLAVGQRGRIVALKGDDPLVQRLMEMGLLEGDEIEVVGYAPLGDPVEIRLADYRLSLRRSEAARILVTLLGDPAA